MRVTGTQKPNTVSTKNIAQTALGISSSLTNSRRRYKEANWRTEDMSGKRPAKSNTRLLQPFVHWRRLPCRTRTVVITNALEMMKWLGNFQTRLPTKQKMLFSRYYLLQRLLAGPTTIHELLPSKSKD